VRVTIDHREEQSGLSGTKRYYFVDCEVLFSEEENAVIAARGLIRNAFIVDAAVPPPAPVHYISATALRFVASLLLIASAVIGLGFNGPLGDSLATISIGVFIAAFFIARRTQFAELPKQTITFQQLLDYPRFTIFASNPARAKAVDEAIRDKLAALKMLLVESTDIPSRATFEL
jgi:hypothetical protein